MREKTRKQRKARFISARNRVLRDIECGNGVYWCNHVYDPACPWVWVDFIFLSERHKGRYFAVAMTTCEYDALNEIEEASWDKADSMFADPDEPAHVAKMHKTHGALHRIEYTKEQEALIKQRRDFTDALTKQNAQIPVAERPKIEVRTEYGPVAVGLWARVNKPYIDDQVIREFIEHFRSLGEPLTHGIVWEGEEIQVVPARLYDQCK